MKIHKWFLVIFVLILLGCAEKEDFQMVSDEASLAEQEAKLIREKSKNNRLDIKDKKIIKTGEIKFETSSLSETREQINKTIKKYK